MHYMMNALVTKVRLKEKKQHTKKKSLGLQEALKCISKENRNYTKQF